MKELELDTGTIVTRNEAEVVETDRGMIQVVPIWRFLLDTPDRPE